MWAVLADLVLPNPCAACGCRGERLTHEVCGDCIAVVEALRPKATRPTPAPEGLPPCYTLGGYEAELRQLIIEFKERGRHRLAPALGALLAEVVASISAPDEPLFLAYIPDSARAARQRHGDHMRVLASAAAARLRRSGWRAWPVAALRTRDRADSAELDAWERARSAESKFTARRLPREVVEVILVDDIVTTGATLAAAARVLAAAGVRVRSCAVLAATARFR